MLHETWPVRKENEVALQRAGMRWMCGVKLQDRVPSKGLRERLGFDNIISALQQNRLRWYGLVLRKEDNGWVKKCMEYEVECDRPTDRPKKTWRVNAGKDRQACKLNSEHAVDRNRWRKLIRDDWWQWWVWVGECFFSGTGSPGLSRSLGQSPKSRKKVVCVCVCISVKVRVRIIHVN